MIGRSRDKQGILRATKNRWTRVRLKRNGEIVEGHYVGTAPNCYDDDRVWLWLDRSPLGERPDWWAGPLEDIEVLSG